jgi:glycosyltransferase involved in cell wall biosynthesis
VARSLAQALAARLAVDPRFNITLCGPVTQLDALGVRQWAPPSHSLPLINWPFGRHSFAAQVAWPSVRTRARDALWFFPHWDVPWYGLPHRYVVMVHDLTLLRIPGATRPERRWLARRWIRHAVRHAARVVVPSGSTAGDLAEFAPTHAHKIRRIPEGVDARFAARAPAVPQLVTRFTGHMPFMLSVGNRKRHKNLGMGVAVLARVPELTWVIAGERFPGWDAVMSEARRAGVADRLLVLDTPTDEVLHSLYAAAALLLFPSRYEGFGLPVAEAMACGTPVVCSNTGSLPEVAGSCATLCDPDDIEAFVSAVRSVLLSGSRQGAACVERARAMTWDSSAQRLAEVLEEAA